MNLDSKKEIYNQQIFQNADLWANYDQVGDIGKKLPILFGSIPEDVQSILDVGCGNGAITNFFPEKYRVVGVDSSEEALRYIKKEKIHSSAERIPVADSAFDMVFSSELIEHLPSEILNSTIGEFKRIARKYIYISVPNNEQLEFYSILCPVCRKTFHAYGHINAFTLNNLQSLLGNDYQILWHTSTGKLVKPYNRTLLKLKQRIAGKYFAPNKYSICPHCGNKEFGLHKGNVLSKLMNAMNLMLPLRKKPYWLMVLFARNPSE